MIVCSSCVSSATLALACERCIADTCFHDATLLYSFTAFSTSSFCTFLSSTSARIGSPGGTSENLRYSDSSGTRVIARLLRFSITCGVRPIKNAQMSVVAVESSYTFSRQLCPSPRCWLTFLACIAAHRWYKL